MSKIIRLVDRSRTVSDWKCPRSRYLGYELGGRGIAKASTSIELFMGITIHDALATIATFHKNGFVPVDIDAIAEAAHHQMLNNLLESQGDVVMPEAVEFAHEQAALVEGLIRGFYLHAWPRLLAAYPIIVCVEQEMEYTLTDGITFMAKPDLILENLEGETIYIEYKSTSSKKENWINSWDTAVQLHSSIRATKQTLGKAPSSVQIVGLYKGWESYGKQSSPFCYAYKKNGNPPFTEDQVQYSYKAGFKRYPTWEMKGGVKAWVESMPENVLADQFPMTAPIFVNDDLVDAFFKQRAIRETQIAHAMEVGEFDDPITGIDAVFPQHFDACVPSFGWACQFKKLCHGNVEDPLTAGFVKREPHHEAERLQFND